MSLASSAKRTLQGLIIVLWRDDEVVGRLKSADAHNVLLEVHCSEVPKRASHWRPGSAV